MRKAFLILFVMVQIFAMASLLKYVPNNFVTLSYVPDVGKFYNDIKSTEIGDSFLNNLGLESMIDSLIRSQAQAYELDADKLYEVKEMLNVAGKNWMAFIIGPFEEADKIKDYIENTGILPDSTDVQVYVEKLDNNLVFYTRKGNVDVVSILKKEENNVPIWVKNTLKDSKVDMVYYSAEKGVFESYFKVYLKENVLVEEGIGKYFDEDVKEKLENILQGKKFSLDDVVNGEGFLLVNVKDGKSILDLLQVLGVLDLLKEEGLDVSIAEKFGGKVFVGADYSEAIENMLYSSEESTPPILTGYVTFNSDPKVILKDKMKSCKEEKDYYLCGDVDIAKVSFKSNKVEFNIPSDLTTTSDINKKVFQKVYKGIENIMVYLDFSKVLNNLFGLDTNSYLIFKVWTEKDEMKSHGELR